MKNSRKDIEIAQVMDWMMELIPVWERPVTCSMISKVLPPEYTMPVVSTALKRLRDMDMMHASVGEKDQTFYFPQVHVKPSDIQKVICKGIKHWNDEGAKDE